MKCLGESSVLLMIDIQQRLGQAMPAKVLKRVVSNSTLLADAAKLLGVPIFYTEQYPQGLGPTLEELAAMLPSTAARFEKTAFSSLGAPEFAAALAALNRSQVIVVGMEAHVCVLQTALDLASRDYDVYVIEDAVCSRRLENYQNALDRLRQSHITVASAESVVFEWLVDARHEHFKSLQAQLR